jgi:hypothetical protein
MVTTDTSTFALELLAEALAEDKREGGRFDRDGWGNYFLEDWKHDPEAVEEAWRLYCQKHREND